MQLEPGTIVENRYRIERLVASHTGVTVWDATDLLQACTVELVLSRGGTMIDVSKVARRAPQPVLELVEISDEDAFFEEPPPPELFYTPPPRSKAPWFVALAAIGCAAIGAGVWYTKHTAAARALASNDEEVTITRAELPLVVTASPPPPPPPAVMTAVEEAPPPPAPKPAKAVVAPKRLPHPRHIASPPPPPPPPLPAHDEPLTL